MLSYEKLLYQYGSTWLFLHFKDVEYKNIRITRPTLVKCLPEFLQVKASKELSDMITRMKRVGDGLGIHIIDKELLD